jgi:hypothetical protein
MTVTLGKSPPKSTRRYRGYGLPTDRRELACVKFDAHTHKMIGGQILQVGSIQCREPKQALLVIHFSEREQRAIGGITSLHRADVDEFHQIVPKDINGRWQQRSHRCAHGLVRLNQALPVTLTPGKGMSICFASGWQYHLSVSVGERPREPARQ